MVDEGLMPALFGESSQKEKGETMHMSEIKSRTRVSTRTLSGEVTMIPVCSYSPGPAHDALQNKVSMATRRFFTPNSLASIIHFLLDQK